MIICVEGHPERNNLNGPGFHLIIDPVVKEACRKVINEPNLSIATSKLQNLLDPNLYTVGEGGHHIYVASTSERDPQSPAWPLRHAMLVDSNDTEIWDQFPYLEDMNRMLYSPPDA